VVVGAGASGLVAAAALAAEHEVVVLDKGRGVGGRMATRRVQGATFDHGAQFVTTHSDTFARVVEGWTGAGVVRPWYRGQVGPRGTEGDDGHVRHRGTVSMNAVAKHLAQDLDVRTGTRVHALTAADGGWRLSCSTTTAAGADATAGADAVAGADAAAEVLSADALVLSPPVPQTLELLAAGGVELAAADAELLARIEYAPCIAVMAVLDQPSGLPAPGAVAPARGPLDWIADNRTKGISAVPALTVHVGAQASRDWWDLPDPEVVQLALDAAAPCLEGPAVAVASSVQRWRYARPTAGLHERCLVPRVPAPMVLVGDAFGEAKVEGAVLSGLAGAEQLRRLLPG
jgi:predicted NAD/FAD-dependent oxidoreductase